MPTYKEQMQEKHKVKDPYKRTPLEHSAYSLAEIKPYDHSNLLKEINRKRSNLLMTITKILIGIMIVGLVIGILLIMAGG
jgi:hypothetical protein